MADSVQTLASLISILADNISGDITPGDIRDLLVSLSMQHGQIGVSGNEGLTTIPDITNFHEVNVAGAILSEQSQVIAGSDDFDMPIVGRLRYIGAQTRTFLVLTTLSFTTESNLQIIHFRLAQNGITSAQAEVRRKTGTESDIGSTAIPWLTSLAQNDYLSLFAKNESNPSDLTVVSYNLLAIGMII